jgi:hypothetical protein
MFEDCVPFDFSKDDWATPMRLDDESWTQTYAPTIRTLVH